MLSKRNYNDTAYKNVTNCRSISQIDDKIHKTNFIKILHKLPSCFKGLYYLSNPTILPFLLTHVNFWKIITLTAPSRVHQSWYNDWEKVPYTSQPTLTKHTGGWNSYNTTEGIPPTLTHPRTHSYAIGSMKQNRLCKNFPHQRSTNWSLIQNP